MCGICGVIQIRGEPRLVVADDVLDAMTDAMVHRGPNDRGTAFLPVRRRRSASEHCRHRRRASAVFERRQDDLGHPERRALQPRQLRDDLRRRGHRFASRCDTEVLPHLYEEDGPDFPRKLRGMFGLAVWDEVRRRGVIARDRLGVKPLYYAICGDLLVFASELKSLLASGLVPVDLDYEAIDAYLTLGYFPAPATPLAAVRKLEPGAPLVIENGRSWCSASGAIPSRHWSVAARRGLERTHSRWLRSRSACG